MEHDPAIEAIEAIYDALDAGEAERALALAQAELLATSNEDPVVRFLTGVALFDLDRAEEAISEFRHAAENDPEDAEFHAYLAWSLFRVARFAEADSAVRRALELDDRLPEGHHVAGLLLERRGELASADRSFSQAARSDPERFPQPMRISSDDFAARLNAARTALEERFRKHLDQVTLLVEEVPSDTLIFDDEPPLDPEQTLGLFVGLPLGADSSFSPGGEVPPRIYLFKRNLERQSSATGDLAEEIRVTLFHELGHFLGMDEDEIERSGYA